MKIRSLAMSVLAASGVAAFAADSSDSSKTPLPSGVIPWNAAADQPTKTGSRRLVFEAPTATLDKFHCHVSNLNPGCDTGAPHRHPQEEIVILKSGALEVYVDGKTQHAEAGAMIFYSANANENMKNVGTVPAIYYVLQFYTEKTPRPGQP
jgi:quercetin dioxygenase-like cupin family protein